MAYMNQEKKKSLSTSINEVFKKHGMKGTISVKHHSTLVVTITEGYLDLIGAANKHNKRYSDMRGTEFYEVKGSYQVNEYHIDENYTGAIKAFLSELRDSMMVGNFDKSDLMTDYFHVGWYIDINVGRWDKPYKLNFEEKAAA